jgi:MFS-type transporter involved in bile tolerance (Atg22 family)
MTHEKFSRHALGFLWVFLVGVFVGVFVGGLGHASASRCVFGDLFRKKEKLRVKLLTRLSFVLIRR